MGVNIKPIGKRIVVEIAQPEEKTAGGLIIPDTAKEKPHQGKVVAVSDEVKNIKVNDTVLYGKYAGTQINLDGKDYLILEENDVLAIL